MEVKKILEMELDKLEEEIEYLRNKIALLKPIAEEDEEAKLDLIGSQILLNLYEQDRRKIASMLA
ncbi:hypothetical protein EYM_01020 [Ignicoccus islandicus DSM 13165]|uniref:Uncharacterized protein n=1 Tax=Ignicoccus islandicus DSM 13165 TaxID=940295 RepID=A0A0U3F964_9CREN|nr:hypothetical protein [Ignicoccus islandicus]ALU12169.1 hypothetical protein EYM_01020 [Ignicoccus islandicus DSM 13165]